MNKKLVNFSLIISISLLVFWIGLKIFSIIMGKSIDPELQGKTTFSDFVFPGLLLLVLFLFRLKNRINSKE